MRKLNDLYNIEGSSFIEEIVKTIQSYKLEDLLVDEYVHRYEIFLDSIASCGTYQSREVAEFFDMKTLLKNFSIIKDNYVNKNSKKYGDAQNVVDFAWDDIDKHASDIADKLSSRIKVPGYNGRFYFGHLEADGAYGLFYTWE